MGVFQFVNCFDYDIMFNDWVKKNEAGYNGTFAFNNNKNIH